jgi:hypothetical protein
MDSKTRAFMDGVRHEHFNDGEDILVCECGSEDFLITKFRYNKGKVIKFNYRNGFTTSDNGLVEEEYVHGFSLDCLDCGENVAFATTLPELKKKLRGLL